MFCPFRTNAILALAAALSVSLAVQAGSQGSAYGQQPAESAAGAHAGDSPHAPQLDAQHRPITEGGFVKTGPIVFEDASEKAGLTKWTHQDGNAGQNLHR